MNEIQTAKPEFRILAGRQKLISKLIGKLSRKIFLTSDIEKKHKLMNELTIQTNEMLKINSIANYLDRNQEFFKYTKEDILKISEKLLNDENQYKKIIKVDKRRKKDFEF